MVIVGRILGAFNVLAAAVVCVRVFVCDNHDM